MTGKEAEKRMPRPFVQLIACTVGWFTFSIAKNFLLPVFSLSNIGSLDLPEDGLTALFFLCLICPLYFLNRPEMQTPRTKALLVVFPTLFAATSWFRLYPNAIPMNILIIALSYGATVLSEKLLTARYAMKKPVEG